MKSRNVSADINQIGMYGDAQTSVNQSQRVNTILTNAGAPAQNKLYADIDQYKAAHDKQIQNSGAQNIQPIETYYRRKFIEVINKIIADNKVRYPDTKEAQLDRKNNPDKAVTTLENFLGPEHKELFKLALEEERYSKEYMNAVLSKAAKDYQADEWNTKPIIVVGGASSTGKTVASKNVARAVLPLVDKKPNASSVCNYLVAVDGGDFREVSQMRKLMIQASIAQGFTGISDLHDKVYSDLLEGAKWALEDYVLDTTNPQGAIVPLTFSKVLGITDELNKYQQCGNSTMFYSLVVGEDVNFQDTVSHMGSRRAFKADFPENTSPTDLQNKVIDLNSTQDCYGGDLVESKKYGAGGYLPGMIGSVRARDKTIVNKDQVVIDVINDLILVKKTPDGKSWIKASSKEPGIMLVSNKVYQDWSKNKNHPMTLEAYSKECRKKGAPPVMLFSQLPVHKLKECFPYLETHDLTQLEKLVNLCTKNGEDLTTVRWGYLGKILMQIHMNDDLWKNQLDYAAERLKDLNRNVISMSDFKKLLTENCGEIGKLLTNSKMMDANKFKKKGAESLGCLLKFRQYATVIENRAKPPAAPVIAAVVAPAAAPAAKSSWTTTSASTVTIKNPINPVPQANENVQPQSNAQPQPNVNVQPQLSSAMIMQAVKNTNTPPNDYNDMLRDLIKQSGSSSSNTPTAQEIFNIVNQATDPKLIGAFFQNEILTSPLNVIDRAELIHKHMNIYVIMRTKNIPVVLNMQGRTISKEAAPDNIGIQDSQKVDALMKEVKSRQQQFIQQMVSKQQKEKEPEKEQTQDQTSRITNQQPKGGN